MPKYRIHSGPVFLRHRPSSRYCCNGNCAVGSKPILKLVSYVILIVAVRFLDAQLTGF